MKNMKLLKIAAVSVLLGCSASAAFAGPTVTGDAAVYGGWLSVNGDADGDNFTDGAIGGLNGRARSGPVQFDLNVEYVNAGYGYEYTTVGGALHLLTSGDNAVGFMAAIGRDGAGEVTVGGAPYTTLALEGTTMLGESRLDAQAGYFIPDDASNYIDSGYYGYLGLTTPLSDKMALNLNVSGIRMAEEGTKDYSYVEAISYGAQLEYEMDSKVIAFLGVNGSHTAEDSESEKWNTLAVMVGLRVPFGGSDEKLVFADHSPLTGVNHLRLNDWQ